MEWIGMDNKINLNKQKGLTLLESLIATVIVGIGFISIFNMVNYSIDSIKIAGERTKSTYVAEMVAEDIMADKDVTVGGKVLYRYLTDLNRSTGTTYKMTACTDGASFPTRTNVFDTKKDKWTNTFSKRRLSCASSKDIREIKTYSICRSGCAYTVSNYYSPVFMGRISIVMNNGKKNKFLYFPMQFENNQ